MPSQNSNNNRDSQTSQHLLNRSFRLRTINILLNLEAMFKFMTFMTENTLYDL